MNKAAWVRQVLKDVPEGRAKRWLMRLLTRGDQWADGPRPTPPPRRRRKYPPKTQT